MNSLKVPTFRRNAIMYILSIRVLIFLIYFAFTSCLFFHFVMYLFENISRTDHLPQYTYLAVFILVILSYMLSRISNVIV